MRTKTSRMGGNSMAEILNTEIDDEGYAALREIAGNVLAKDRKFETKVVIAEGVPVDAIMKYLAIHTERLLGKVEPEISEEGCRQITITVTLSDSERHVIPDKEAPSDQEVRSLSDK